MIIYYCYEKPTGRFAGSGITFFDSEWIGCTETPVPFFTKNQIPYWENGTWVLKEKSASL